MKTLLAAQAEKMPEVEFLTYDARTEVAQFALLGELGDAAVSHYDSAPTIHGEKRRIGSFVHLGSRAAHIDMEPDAQAQWLFTAHKVGQRVAAQTLAITTDALLYGTSPVIDPIVKGLKLAQMRGVTIHPNQVSLLSLFDKHVLYEDEDVLALNKPPYVVSIWTPDTHIGAAEIVRRWRGSQASPVHRIDRLTSGVLLFGKNRATRRNLSMQIGDKTDDEVEKQYIAIVEGTFEGEEFIECYIEPGDRKVTVNDHGETGKLAQTTVRQVTKVQSADGMSYSVVEARLHTGRQHQIRASLAHIGKPIVGDPLYNRGSSHRGMRLHAANLRVLHPRSGKPLKIKAPLPADFMAGMSK